MQFAKLSEYFENLEKTSSRLILIDILSKLFSEIDSSEEIEKICYLVQGRIGPFFEPIEIGMAEKTVTKAIALAYGTAQEQVWETYLREGDIGLTVEKFCSHNASKSTISISEVMEVLRTIAMITGDGTIEKKISLFSNLLHNVSVKSAKYLVRIPLGNLRLGIGDPTILDALAKAKFGDKSHRKLLESAYNKTSDLGLIGKTLWEHTSIKKIIHAIDQLHIQVGKPIRSELCERLPTPEKVIEKMGEVDVQSKYDGFRAQIHKNGNKIAIFSRNLENMTHMFPELIEAAKTEIKAHCAIIDSEALAYNPASEEFLPFQETTKRRRKYKIQELAIELPLKAFVFDILFKDGKSLIEKPLSERIEILKKTIPSTETLIPALNQRVNDPKKLTVLLEDAISKGLEGLVIKKLTSKYEAGGRNFNWVKLKRHSSGELKDTLDCVVLGYIFGKGKRTAFGAGALLVGVYDKKKDIFVTVSKIGTGLSDEEWQSIKIKTKGLESEHKPARVDSLIIPSVWVKPALVIEVLADEITRSPIHTAGKDSTDTGYALRFPRLVTFRDLDRKAEDATTLNELIEMYKSQSK